MKRLRRISGWLSGVAMIAMAAAPAQTPPPSRPVPSLRTLPAKAFEALPADALLDLDGRKLTKAQFLAEMEEHRARMSAKKPPLPSASEGPSLDLSALRSRLLEGERSRRARRIQPSGVAGSLGLAVQVAGPTPTPDPCTAPKITVVSAATPLEVADDVILNGCGFGLKDPASELRLVGQFPGGYLKLQIVKWRGDGIEAKVPSVSAVKDQPNTKLQVVRKDLKLSNEWPIAFYATRDVSLLTPDDVKRTCAWSPVDADCRPFTHTVRSDYWLKTAYFSGSDTVTASLKNGCVLTGYGWSWHGAQATLDQDPTPGLTVGSSQISMKIDYELWAYGNLHFDFDVYAFGPAGIPCH